jgi:peptide/nickel transport system ATP-binding protein
VISPDATATADSSPCALAVNKLRVETLAGAEIVCGVSFAVQPGEVLALVGESGCGKSCTALALLGHARPGTRITSGTVQLGAQDVLALDHATLRGKRGSEISYVPQDPMGALNPRHRVANQVAETLVVHGVSASIANDLAAEILARVHLPTDGEFLRRYPFELSGGQQQRVAIAMGLIAKPKVIVLDEPTTGLDVTTQARVLDLLISLAKETRSAFVYITHDLAVVSGLADRVAVMYAGRIVEAGPCTEIFQGPAHPYTALLLRSIPRMSASQRLTGIPGRAPAPHERPEGCPFAPRCPLAVARCREEFPPATRVSKAHTTHCWRWTDVILQGAGPRVHISQRVPETLLVANSITASYGARHKRSTVVDDVSFSVPKGGCLAIVGESGSGKSTLARCIAGLHRPDRGTFELEGVQLAPIASERSRIQLRNIQIVFQNPDRSLNPRETVATAIWRPLRVFEHLTRKAAQMRIEKLLEQVRLPSGTRNRYPRELSGGEKQRVAIARALAARPAQLICDEITSSLDVSIQAAVVELLEELRADGLAMLFITHNLSIVRSIAEQTLVLRNGHVCEYGETSTLISRASDAYTRELIAAAPDIREPQSR